MRGIGDEVLLRIEGMAHAVEQQVQLLHQRAHLLGQVLFAHRRQVVRLARRYLLAHARHGGQRPAHDPPHDQHQQRRHQRHRRDGAQGQRAGHVAPRRPVLRHLDHQPARLHREHAVGGAARSARRAKPEHRCGSAASSADSKMRTPSAVHTCTDEIEILFAGANSAYRRARRQACAQRKRHLLHVVVEDVVGLGRAPCGRPSSACAPRRARWPPAGTTAAVRAAIRSAPSSRLRHHVADASHVADQVRRRASCAGRAHRPRPRCC